MNDFIEDKSGEDITAAIAGKQIASVKVIEDRADTYLEFLFTDGTRLVFHYDYIDKWALNPADD